MIENVKDYVAKNLADHSDKINFVNNAYDALEKADCLAILTEWSIFRTPDFEKMKGQMAAPVIFDGRNLYELATIEGKGFQYNSIGRGEIK